MQTRPRRLTAAVALSALVAGTGPALADEPFVTAAAPTPVTVSLTQYFDNNGIDSASARDGNFDGSGYTYPAEALPTGGITVDGVPFTFPSAAKGVKNNIVAMGQTLDIPRGKYHAGHFLVAGSYGMASGTATVHYADGGTTTASLAGPDWYNSSGPISASYRYAPNNGTDQHPVAIAAAQIWLDAGREAVSVTLPVTQPAQAGQTSLHVFAMTVQAAAKGRALSVRNARSTTKLLSGNQQAIEATVTNLGDTWITEQDAVSVSADVFGARTVQPAAIRRLAPGEEARVRIGIVRAGAPVDTIVNGQVVAQGRRLRASQPVRFTLGVVDYQATDASLGTHESPYWFDDAKFGIFVHWGVYSVPAWSPPGVQYAEWYWRWMEDPNNAVYGYHAQTYGKDFKYDDFIPQFTAAKFDPKAWVRLFQAAGAKYYVLTSKHHEGFALFDSKVSGRDSVDLGPHRDLVKELFDASRKYTPDLRNGLYFSMPEWYNPDSPWMGHAPKNPYTGAAEPYTGYQAGRDFVHDYQAPQMHEIVNQYDPDVIWCDIGGANDSRTVMADYFNRAKNRPNPKDVTVDDRCGIPTHDYTTPEYTTYPDTVVQKWEASRGLDPRSYGYNKATPDSMYMTADQVVDTLVDITSKNGNFLLDIGPRADGTIPEIMRTRLTETGDWLKANGESVYGTTYWSRMAGQGALRFSVKPNEAFYITSLERPGDQIVVDAPVPIRPGDRVTVLGYQGPDLKWTQQNGKLTIQVPEAAKSAGQYAWVLKIAP
ncbi:alpha-L-fucosidase [Actinocrispum wychmicini]|uniref:alpha-L-fucosidase n=1 Tax=Actinocrispum wychmicini TaxID=1213861 RepID=A0A4R2IR67_9PSEU|nr:alpha-L-fucosidase [Actinocrispum wychmicini]TCO46609.1 alpha-L-fucosidase [Actinocrispum wychmicini]